MDLGVSAEFLFSLILVQLVRPSIPATEAGEGSYSTQSAHEAESKEEGPGCTVKACPWWFLNEEFIEPLKIATPSVQHVSLCRTFYDQTSTYPSAFWDFLSAEFAVL